MSIGDKIYEEELGYVFHEGTSCYVKSVSYDFKKRRGVLRMPPHSSTDMTGCIDLFKRIDPRVERIRTISGNGGTDYDSLYVLVGKQWFAKVLPEKTVAGGGLVMQFELFEVVR